MIHFDFNNLIIDKYKSILKISDDEIVVLINKKTVFIKGVDMYINYFEKDEFEVKGKINKIEVFD